MKRTPVLFPKFQRMLAQTGSQIRLARLRRGLSTEIVADRAGIIRATLRQIEQGIPSVSMGGYFMVLAALNLENDILLLAKDDELGRKLQDLNLPVRQRAKKRG